MSMEGLFRRGGPWWARLAVPARLRPAAKRREFTKTTGTHEYAIEDRRGCAARRLAQAALSPGATRMHDEAVLRLVEGGPALAGDGFVSLVQAARATGLEVTDLLAEAAAGRLALGCRLPSGAGRGYVVDPERLHRADPERGGLEIPVAAPKGSVDVDFTHRTLRLRDGGHDVAEAVLADELDRVQLVVFQAEWGNADAVFCPDTVVEVDPLALVVRQQNLSAFDSPAPLWCPRLA